MGRKRTGAEHHTAAAEQHEQAASRHRDAAEHYDAKGFAEAAHQGLIAHDHTRKAMHHGHEATKYRLEHDEATRPADTDADTPVSADRTATD